MGLCVLKTRVVCKIEIYWISNSRNYKPEYERLKQKQLKKNAELEREKLESIKSKLEDYDSVIGGAKESLLKGQDDGMQRRIKHPGETGIDLAAFRQLNTNDDEDEDEERYKNRDEEGSCGIISNHFLDPLPNFSIFI